VGLKTNTDSSKTYYEYYMLFDKKPNTETKEIAQIFNNTVATYKYYWFISILDIVVKEHA